MSPKVQPSVEYQKAQECREESRTSPEPRAPPSLRVVCCVLLCAPQTKGINGDAPHDALARVSRRISRSRASERWMTAVEREAMVLLSTPDIG